MRPLAFGLFLLVAAAIPAARADRLFLVGALDTGAFPCQDAANPGVTRSLVTASPWHIKNLVFFPGNNGGSIQDFRWVVSAQHRDGSQELLFPPLNWDRYKDPTFPQFFQWPTPAGDWFEIFAGDTVTLNATCVHYSGTIGMSQVIVWIYGTRVQ
jgi:hypothetical protein